MSNTYRGKFFFLLTFSIILSLFLAVPVFADGSDELSPEEETPVEETILEPEAAPVVPAEAVLTPEIVEDEQADADCEDSADPADPYYYVGTTKYEFLPYGETCTPGTEGITCFVSSSGGNPIQDAIEYVPTSGLPTDRKIYVESGTYTGNTNIDGSIDPLFGQLNGLVGVDGSGATTLNGSVSLNWSTGGFTLSGFTINGLLSAQNMTGTIMLEDLQVSDPSGPGITMTNNINSQIVMDNVSASGNAGGGAYIDNQQSGLAYNITIKNSHFDNNADIASNVYGLKINTLGKVTLENVTANYNRGLGISIISDFSSLSIKNLVLVENDADPNTSSYAPELMIQTTAKANVTLENVYVGADPDISSESIEIHTGGNVLIRNMNITKSAQTGLYVDATPGTGSVKIYDSQFSNCEGYGAVIYSLGPVYISSIKANENLFTGLHINNCQNSGTCTGIGTVTITSQKSAGIFGANEFNDNGGDGLNVDSGKAISLTNFTADGNLNNGIVLTNHYGSGGVTITQSIPSSDYLPFANSTRGNLWNGLSVYSTGAIRVEHLLAKYNAYQGAVLENYQSASSPGIMVLTSDFSSNDQTGLSASSNGSISLTNVSANLAGVGGYHGVYLSTLSGTSGSVTIKGIKGYTCQFNSNSGHSIMVYALGNVLLGNIESIDNGQGIYVENYFAALPKKVTLTNIAANNTLIGDGLYVRTRGAVSINTITASNNQHRGATIDAYDGTGNVTIKYGEFHENSIGSSWHSLYITSTKNITLYNVSASDNGQMGVYLDNCLYSGSCVGTGSVSIKTGKGYTNTFSRNESYGLYISSKGNITLTNFSVTENKANGIYIDNDNDVTSGNVTLTASGGVRNLVANNDGFGVMIYSHGNITVSYLDSYNNEGRGAHLQNNNNPYNRTIKVVDSTFNMNRGDGLYAEANGTITLQGVECSDNSIFHGTLNIAGSGAIDVLSQTRGHDTWTFTAAAPGAGYEIVLTSVHFDAYLELYSSDGELIGKDDNSAGSTDATLIGTVPEAGDYVIVVKSADGLGSGFYRLELNSTSASYYSYYGAQIINTNGTGAVKILKSAKMGFGVRLINNNYIGLSIQSNGPVSIANLEAYYNGGDNVYVVNTSDAEQPVTLNMINTEGSHNAGILVSSRGNISTNKIKSLDNYYEGASLNSFSGAKAHTIKVVNGFFIGNDGDSGLEIFSNGTVTLTNVISFNPDASFGTWIDTRNGIGNVIVNGKENIFDNNGGVGLYIDSYGEISLTNISASNNTGEGVHAQNAYFGYTPKNIKVNNSGNGYNELNDNANRGLYLRSYGLITVNKTRVNGNSGSTELRNTDAPAVKKITVTNSIFDSGSAYGLTIYAYGPIALTNVRASNNSQSGIYMVNTSAPGEDMILNNVTTYYNLQSGISLDSAGALTINGVTSFGNSKYGMDAKNYSGIEGIKVSNSIFNENTFSGLMLQSDGAVILSNVSAMQNHLYGINVQGYNTSIAITLSKVNAAWNSSNGINLFNTADVMVTLTNSVANGGLIDADGIAVYGNGTNLVTINKCVFLSNVGSGIDLQNIGSYLITNTIAFGNDTNANGEEDIYIP